jgi:hypothetical protein
MPYRYGMRFPETRISRRLFLQAGLVTFAAACTRPSQSPPASGMTPILGQPTGSGAINLALPASDLAVGQDQRFLVALIGPGNQLITDARVELAFFKVTGPESAQLRARSSASYQEPPGARNRGIYVARADFDEAGDWGVAAVVERPGAQPAEVRTSFKVKPTSETPAIGAPAPPSRTLTGRTPQDVEAFCSARPGDVEFHQHSVAEAIGLGKPTAILFATPGFCESMLCGPSLEVLKLLRERYADGVNLVHVEIYKDGRPNERREMVPAVAEWKLPSEPWLFVVDSSGRIADKLEGSITLEETTPVLDRLLSA